MSCSTQLAPRCSAIGDTVNVRSRPHSAARGLQVSGVALARPPDVLLPAAQPVARPAPRASALERRDPAARDVSPAACPRGPRRWPATSTGASAGSPRQTGVQLARSRRRSIPERSPGGRSRLHPRRAIRTPRNGRLPWRVQFVDNLSSALNTAAADACTPRRCSDAALPGAISRWVSSTSRRSGPPSRPRSSRCFARSAPRGANCAAWQRRATISVVVAGLLGAGWLSRRSACGSKARSLDALTALGRRRVRLLPTLGASGTRFAHGRCSRFRARSPSASQRAASGEAAGQRLYLDLLALATQLADLWLTASHRFLGGRQPRSNPTRFAVDLLFSLRRCCDLHAADACWVCAGGSSPRSLGASWSVARPTGRRGVLLASAVRRGASINRGPCSRALRAFGVSLGVFTPTYDPIRRSTPQLTARSDVTDSSPPGVRARRAWPSASARHPRVRRRPRSSLLRIRRPEPAGYFLHRRRTSGSTTLRNAYSRSTRECHAPPAGGSRGVLGQVDDPPPADTL